MAAPKSVWGIDIGQCALKALKLRSINEELQLEAFDYIEHPKILSQPDVDRDQLIRNALDQFLARNSVAGSILVVSVPGQSSFTRFVQLPPVEPKKIPDIVRFEAEQQIPFAIDDVVWQWQLFQGEDSFDVEVGIFAVKREDIAATLGYYSSAGMPIDIVQVAPLSLYNYLMFDGVAAADGATLLADIGAERTNLVVADGSRAWMRTIHVGGNDFTDALMRAFKLSFARAEKLKRTAVSSKYARQIFQAMRPVFGELAQEVQRSIGYYTSLHRESRFRRLIGLGSGFRLPGLQKFLEQNLSLPVVRVNGFRKLAASATVNTPQFAENVLSFAVAYGLGVQGLDQAAVATNLLPREILRRRLWRKKRPWIAAVAAILVLAMLGVGYGQYRDLAALRSAQDLAVFQQTKQIVLKLKAIKSRYDIIPLADNAVERMDKYKSLYQYREYWPKLAGVLGKAIRQVATDQRYVEAYITAADEAARKQALDALKAKPRSRREVAFVEKMGAAFVLDVLEADATALLAEHAGGKKTVVGKASSAGKPAGKVQEVKKQRGLFVYTLIRTPLDVAMIDTRFREALFNAVGAAARQDETLFKLVGKPVHQFITLPHEPVAADPGDPAKAQVSADPLFAGDPTESRDQDVVFATGWLVSIEGKEPEAGKTAEAAGPGR